MDQEPLAQTLQFIHPQTISKADCKARLQKLMGRPDKHVYDSNVCTINKMDVGACMGDSGEYTCSNIQRAMN